MRRFLLILMAGLLFAGTSVYAAPYAGTKAERARQAPAVTWQFDTKEDSNGTPQTRIFLVVGGRRVFLLKTTGNFSEVDRSDYASRKIPAGAMTACTGWWAGSGDDLYVVRRGRQLIVYNRVVDEQAPIPRYGRLKVIPLR